MVLLMFLRKAKHKREPVPVTMSGVRMGERLLQIGVDDPGIAGAIAAKVGLSGNATSVVEDDATAARARASGRNAGVLIDVHVSALDKLPFGDDAFDVIVVHSSHGLLPRMDERRRTGAAREWFRVLRRGGRVVTIEPGPRTGVTALLRGGTPPDPAYEAAGGTSALLMAGGFRAVRVVGQLEGFTFVEGLKS